MKIYIDFLLKLYKNQQRCFMSSRKFLISYSVLNLSGLFWKMGKLEISLPRSEKQSL